MSETDRPSRVRRYISAVSNVLRITRNITLNVAFIAVVAFYAFLLSGPRVKPILDRTTLVIEPEGKLVEQFSGDPIGRAIDKAIGIEGEVQLRDLTRAIEAASKDPRIERIVLRLDKLSLNGLASRAELSMAIAQAKATGKQVIASSDAMTQGQYQLAAQASELYLDPKGAIDLRGFAGYSFYFREALEDKLGVDVELFKVGAYKSAMEPFTLDAASSEAKQAESHVLSDQWQSYLADVAKARKLDPASIERGIDRMPAALAEVNGDLAKLALRAKLVDGLRTRDDVDQLLKERGLTDESAKGGFRQVSLADYLAVIDKSAKKDRDAAKVAVVVAEGSIVRGEAALGQVGGVSTSALLRRAAQDDAVKAVVLRVNSPGGEVFASEQISREILRLRKAGKPVVASMGDYAASGGYQISMNADRIFASPTTVTGSIGVFGAMFNVSRALEKMGVRTDGVATTRLAGAAAVMGPITMRPLPQEYREVAQQVVEKVYRDFTGDVATARKMSSERVEAVAQGRIWTGAQAKDLGLVDELGGLKQAIAFAAKMAKLGSPGNYRVEYVEKERKPMEKLLGGLATSKLGLMAIQGSGVDDGLLSRVAPQAAGQLKFIEESMAGQDGRAIEVMAHCLCGP